MQRQGDDRQQGRFDLADHGKDICRGRRGVFDRAPRAGRLSDRTVCRSLC